MDKIEERLINMLHGFSFKDAKADSTFESLNMDSIDDVEMIMATEEEFGIEISDEDAEKIKSVPDAVAYLKQRLPK